MKKLICVMLCALLLGSAALADDAFDLSVIRNNDNLTIDVNRDEGVAFVESTLSTGSRAFEHSREASELYSSTKHDLLILDYFSSEPYPIFRLWFNLSTDDRFYYVNSVTFTLGGKDYTFTDVADPDWFYELDNGYLQQLLIKFGVENVDFTLAVLDLIGPLETADDYYAARVPVVFHGTEDITAELSAGYLVEYLLFTNVLLESNGVDYLDKANDTPMKVTDAAR